MAKTKEELQKAIEEANAELAALEKSEKDGGEVDAIDELMKALDEYEGLQKSEKEEEKEEKEEEKKEKEEEMEKSIDDLEGLEQELVKASEEYAKLCKSVQDFGGRTQEAIAGQNTRLDAISALLVGQSKAIVSLAKSMKEFASQPFEKSHAQVGGGSHDEKQGDVTSKSDAINILKKAMEDGDASIQPALLGRVSVKGTWVIPSDIAAKHNIKLPSA